MKNYFINKYKTQYKGYYEIKESPKTFTNGDKETLLDNLKFYRDKITKIFFNNTQEGGATKMLIEREKIFKNINKALNKIPDADNYNNPNRNNLPFYQNFIIDRFRYYEYPKIIKKLLTDDWEINNSEAIINIEKNILELAEKPEIHQNEIEYMDFLKILMRLIKNIGNSII